MLQFSVTYLLRITSSYNLQPNIHTNVYGLLQLQNTQWLHTNDTRPLFVEAASESKDFCEVKSSSEILLPDIYLLFVAPFYSLTLFDRPSKFSKVYFYKFLVTEDLVWTERLLIGSFFVRTYRDVRLFVIAIFSTYDYSPFDNHRSKIISGAKAICT